jgi:hypothetical protein
MRETNDSKDHAQDGLPSLRPKGQMPFVSKISADELGDLDDFDDLDDSDFSFVPKKTSGVSEQVEGNADKPTQAARGAKADLPFGEPRDNADAPVKDAPEAPFGESPESQSKSDAAKNEATPKGTPEPLSQEAPKETPKEKSPSKAEEMEVMAKDEEKSRALSRSSEPSRAVSKWAFWKRPSRRDEQLARISDGYLEMVDLVRAIRGQLESQNENNLILRDSLAHLPQAMEGLDSFSKSQESVGEALREIHGQMQRSNDKDNKLVESMDGFNHTLQGMDVTNRATMKTFDRVHERMGESDTRMENLFENVQESEGKVSDTIVRLQRSMAIMQGIFLLCLLIVIGVLIFFVMKTTAEAPAPAPQATEQSAAEKKAPEGVTPRPAREVGIPLTRD